MTRVSTQKLRDTASQLTQMNQQLKGKAEEFTSSGNNLFSKWEGDTKQAHQQVFQKDRTQIDNFISLINEYVQALERIATKYDQAEAQNVQTAVDRKY